MPKLHVLSDLHLDMLDGDPWDWSSMPAEGEADIAIVAGDLSNTKEESYAWLTEYAKRFPTRVLILTLGNHDFYNSTFEAVRTWWSKCELIKSGRLHLLDNTSVVLHGVLFVGTTLWTDIKRGNKDSIRLAKMYMADYDLIYKSASDVKDGVVEYTPVSVPTTTAVTTSRLIAIDPRDTITEHQISIKFLESVAITRENAKPVLQARCESKSSESKTDAKLSAITTRKPVLAQSQSTPPDSSTSIPTAAPPIPRIVQRVSEHDTSTSSAPPVVTSTAIPPIYRIHIIISAVHTDCNATTIGCYHASFAVITEHFPMVRFG